MKLKEIRQLVEKQMTPARWRHTLGVVQAAVKLARMHQVDTEKAELAALLHDLGRDMPSSSLLEIAKAQGLVTHPVEARQPDLLHGPVAAFLAGSQWGIKDGEVTAAIAQHTLGAPRMSRLAKVIYLADMIEPGRDYPGVEELRRLAEHDLDQALLAGFDQTVRYCLERGYLLHPATIEARNALLLKDEG